MKAAWGSMDPIASPDDHFFPLKQPGPPPPLFSLRRLNGLHKAGGNCACWLSLTCDTLPCPGRCPRSWPQGTPAPRALTRPLISPWLCSLCCSSSSFAPSSDQWWSQMPSLQTCQPTWLPLPAPLLQTLVALHSFRSVPAPSAVHLHPDVRQKCFQPKSHTVSKSLFTATTLAWQTYVYAVHVLCACATKTLLMALQLQIQDSVAVCTSEVRQS